jgi:hypothetical protein
MKFRTILMDLIYKRHIREVYILLECKNQYIYYPVKYNFNHLLLTGT